MTWMNKWPGGFPLFLSEARKNKITDIDGNDYIDFALGDTGAMAGHQPYPTIQAITQRLMLQGGVTTMLPTEEADQVGAELSKRFGLPYWSFTLSATDANRWALRLARLITNRPKILVFSYSYHGTVDESFVVYSKTLQKTVQRPGNVGPAVDPSTTTRCVEFNDLEALKRELAHQDVAAVLMEPALTNIGIVLPEPGFLEGVREATKKTGTLLINDETHTFSAGVGGATKFYGLSPDIVTIGKSIGGGIPCGAYGISAEVQETVQRVQKQRGVDLIDVGGVGGTLAGNALSITAMKATLEKVFTEENFARMIELCDKYTQDVENLIEKYNLPWSIKQLGARAEYRFIYPAPKNGTLSNEAHDAEIEEYLHLYLINRGIIITPFHNMALMSPETSYEDVAYHKTIFEQALKELTSNLSPKL